MNNRQDFDKIANEIFFPAYEVIARNALSLFGSSKGSCLDIGCGGGHLGLSVAKASNMRITLMDISEDALEIANARIKDWGLENKASTTVGDVCSMSFPKNSFDLIVSRGSIGFWGDRDKMIQAFSEIHRVLKPGAITYIGKGFGNAQLAREINVKMKGVNPQWPGCLKASTNGFGAQEYADFLNELGIENEIIDDDGGVWVVIKKPD